MPTMHTTNNTKINILSSEIRASIFNSMMFFLAFAAHFDCASSSANPLASSTYSAPRPASRSMTTNFNSTSFLKYTFWNS
jgi:hypothetical protein